MASGTYIDEFGEKVKKSIAHPMKKLTGEQIKSIAEEYKDGTNTYTLAEKYGCYRHTISKHLKKQGIEVTIKKASSAQDLAQIVQLYQSGLTAREVGERFGISATTVQLRLHANGIAVRGRWG